MLIIFLQIYAVFLRKRFCRFIENTKKQKCNSGLQKDVINLQNQHN